MLIRLALAGVLSLALSSCVIPRASAFDKPEYQNVDPKVRDWFKSVKNAKGWLCCDIADGHPAIYESRDSGYWVRIDDQWWPVPEEAVIRGKPNPLGEAVVWYVPQGIGYHIRCFVPGVEG